MKGSILFKLWKFPRLSETFLIAQVITALELGFQVKILVDDDWDSIEKSPHVDVIKRYNLLDKIILENYNVPSSRVLATLKSLWLLIINLWHYKKIYFFLRESRVSRIRSIHQFQFYKRLRNFDILHVQYGTNVRPLDLLKKIKLWKPKIIVSFHGHDLYFPINGLIPNNGYYINTFKYSEKLIANTPYLKSLLKRYGAPNGKIITIPVGVNTNFFFPLKEKPKVNCIKIISVGRLQVFKGHKYGVLCVKQLIEKGFDIQYTIIGDGEQYNFLKELVHQYELDDKVDLVGKKTQAELRDILQTQDLFLMTSITDPNYGVESQGLVTAEAQACGLPVIAFDSGGVKFTIKEEETGFIVPERDVNAMADRVEYLISDQQLRKMMSEKAVEYIKKYFSLEVINKKWSEIYNELLDA